VRRACRSRPRPPSTRPPGDLLAVMPEPSAGCAGAALGRPVSASSGIGVVRPMSDALKDRVRALDAAVKVGDRQRSRWSTTLGCGPGPRQMTSSSRILLTWLVSCTAHSRWLNARCRQPGHADPGDGRTGPGARIDHGELAGARMGHDQGLASGVAWTPVAVDLRTGVGHRAAQCTHAGRPQDPGPVTSPKYSWACSESVNQAPSVTVTSLMTVLAEEVRWPPWPR
jgi:hypothetical protein